MTNDNCVSNNIFFGTQSWKLIGDSVIKQNLREQIMGRKNRLCEGTEAWNSMFGTADPLWVLMFEANVVHGLFPILFIKTKFTYCKIHFNHCWVIQWFLVYSQYFATIIITQF